MTEEQKQLLIKDLCGRLPYGVNILHVKDGIIGVLSNIDIFVEGREQKLKFVTSFYGDYKVPIEEFKPYLYPLSSMTKEQRTKYGNLNYVVELTARFNSAHDHVNELYDWLNKHHFDYRGLIEQGLAIDATGVAMYSEEEQP